MGTRQEAGVPPLAGRVPAVPPGFASLTSFALERIGDEEGGDAGRAQVRKPCCTFDEGALRKIIRKKPWISFGMSRGVSEGSAACEVSDNGGPSGERLPEGVKRGCPDCGNRQKVAERWHPEELQRSILEAPTFYPSEEEFKDTIKYISSIRTIAEPYGICRIVPPSSWKPPCSLKERRVWENLEFFTHVQPVDKWQTWSLFKLIGRVNDIVSRKRQRVSSGPGEESYRNKNFREIGSVGYDSPARLSSERGPSFTLKDFEKYADDFIYQYFHPMDMNTDLKTNQISKEQGWSPTIDHIEGEFWRIIEKPTEEIEVLCGVDIETSKFSSGFPIISSDLVGCSFDDRYLDSGWNLNNTCHLPGSILTFESGDIPGAHTPLLHIGMCFSSIFWHVEQHYLYSLCYLHLGAPRVWYGVPSRYASKFEASTVKLLSSTCGWKPDLLNNQVTRCSPFWLKSQDIPVYRCVQNSGEYVLTFPRSYHFVLDCGFSCAEAVNVAPIDWLPYGQNAVGVYSEQKQPVSISQDKLLLGAARKAVGVQWNISFLKKNLTSDDLVWRDACGFDKILARAFKARINVESKRRDFFCRSLKFVKMGSVLDANINQRCMVCHFDLHLSAIGCSCTPDKFACLKHVKQLCQCDESKKFVRIRYAISELNTLADALEGKLSAIHRWAISDLGLSLSSRNSKHVNKEQDTAIQASLVDSQDDGICSNLRKELCTGQASGSQSLFLPQDQICHKNVANISTGSEVGANTTRTSGAILPQISSDSNAEGQSSLKAVIQKKDPTLAKAVQTMKSPAELLCCGTIVSAGSWSTSDAIFTRGYKSRVRYINLKDPSQMCYYTSEILDGGIGTPLFMVQMEQCKSEIFIHTSASKCWDMVREKVNQEIRRLHSFGKFDVPIQPPSVFDGLQMFGLTSSTIVQALEALDTNHECVEYWKAKMGNTETSADTNPVEPKGREPVTQKRKFSNATFNGLLKNANIKELDVLRQILTDDQPGVKTEAVHMLNEEISSRSKGIFSKY